jgi:protocatechuate 3,4-dioxygenase beta subunit
MPTSTAAATGTPAASPASSATPSASATPSTLSCVVRPELTEGPYFVDEMLNRSDIRSDPSDGSVREGLPLQLGFRVGQVSGGVCTPLAGATVDVWHCDALGIYSDVADPGFNTVGQKFLRGYQLSDANGAAQFITIYPGWYEGRTVHMHFKIRVDVAGQSYEFTSQLFFDDAVTDEVHAQLPYASKGQRTLRNDGDGIFQAGGNQLVLSLTPAAAGYAAAFDIGIEI